jgi:hypothetical protein
MGIVRCNNVWVDILWVYLYIFDVDLKIFILFLFITYKTPLIFSIWIIRPTKYMTKSNDN